MSRQHTYIAIDLKSFYASVECVERGLDPLTTNLVVADASRTVVKGLRNFRKGETVRGGAEGERSE